MGGGEENENPREGAALLVGVGMALRLPARGK